MKEVNGRVYPARAGGGWVTASCWVGVSIGEPRTDLGPVGCFSIMRRKQAYVIRAICVGAVRAVAATRAVYSPAPLTMPTRGHVSTMLAELSLNERR